MTVTFSSLDILKGSSGSPFGANPTEIPSKNAITNSTTTETTVVTLDLLCRDSRLYECMVGSDLYFDYNIWI